MRKQVIIFECDNLCGETAKAEGPDDGFNRLPEGWAEVRVRGNHISERTQQLCTHCFMAVGNALGERQNEAKR